MLWLAALLLQTTTVPSALDAFVSKDKAHVLLPPVAVSSHVARTYGWSSDGKRALVLSIATSKIAIDSLLQGNEGPAEGKWTLTLWNEERGQSTVVLSASTADAPPPVASQVCWVGSSAYLLDPVRTGEEDAVPWRLIHVPAQGMATDRRFSPGSGEFRLTTGMPATAGALVLTQKAPEGFSLTVRFLRPAGPDERTHRVVALRPVFEWLGTKNQLAFLVGADARQADSWRAIGLDGSIVPRTEFLGLEEREARHTFRLAETALALSSSRGRANLRSLLIKEDRDEEKSEALVAADSGYADAAIAPDGNAILYVSRGVAMTRRIVHLDKTHYLRMRDAALRSEAMSDARLCAMALLMYSSDNDDVAPPPGDRDKLFPYIKDRSILDRFVYTFPGGSLEGLQNPSEVEIGYVEGPGGRAIAYADGHVKWRKD